MELQKKWYEKYLTDLTQGLFVITDKRTDKFFATIGYTDYDSAEKVLISGRLLVGELEYRGSKEWVEAIELIFDYYVQKLNVDVIYAHVVKENIASRCWHKKWGFKENYDKVRYPEELIVNDMKQEEQALTLQEQMKKQAEEQQLDQMVGTFYKPDYKMYIFKGEDMYNEEFLAALDNSATYRRTAQDLERIISILGSETTATTPVDVTTVDEIENSSIVEEEGCDDEDDENVGCPVFYNE